MGKRSRPRRHERRAAAAAWHAHLARHAVRWADQAVVGSTVAWVVVVLATWLIVSATDAPTFRWGFLGPSRQGNPPLEFDMGGDGAMVLATSLMAVPVVLAAIGRAETRARARAPRQDGPRPLSIWSSAGALAVVALVPNLLGCLWVSGTRAESSGLLLLPEAWPYLAVVFVPLAWEARILVGYGLDTPGP